MRQSCLEAIELYPFGFVTFSGALLKPFKSRKCAECHLYLRYDIEALEGLQRGPRRRWNRPFMMCRCNAEEGALALRDKSRIVGGDVYRLTALHCLGDQRFTPVKRT